MKAEQAESRANAQVSSRSTRRLRTSRVKRQPAFLKAYAKCGTISGACRAMRMERRLVYQWRERDPEFKAAMDEAFEVSIETIEGTAFSIAVEDRNASMVQFLLKKWKPSVYGDTQPKYVGNMPVPQQQTTFNVANIKLSELSDEGLDLVERMVKGFIASLDERDRLASQAQLPVLDVPKVEEKQA